MVQQISLAMHDRPFCHGEALEWRKDGERGIRRGKQQSRSKDGIVKDKICKVREFCFRALMQRGEMQ
jgi:hypothetical protein